MPVRLEQQLSVVQPTMERRFGLMAETLLVRTNDARLLAAAEASFGRFAVPPDDRPPLVVDLFLDRTSAAATGNRTSTMARRVRHRAQGDLYLVDGAGGDRVVIRLDDGVALGFVTEATLADPARLRYDYLEAMALSMIPRGRGYLTIHAAGVVRNGVGVVLHGPAGAGKSTLAMACARRGFGVLAEDAVFARASPTGIELWGLPWMQRLLPDAREHFPELAGFEPRIQPNGEAKIEVDLDALLPGRAMPCAPAGPIVHLVRDSGGPTRMEALDPSDVTATLGIHWPWDGGWTAAYERRAEALQAGGVYRLHMNGPVDAAVVALTAVLDARVGAVPAAGSAG